MLPTYRMQKEKKIIERVCLGKEMEDKTETNTKMNLKREVTQRRTKTARDAVNTEYRDGKSRLKR